MRFELNVFRLSSPVLFVYSLIAILGILFSKIWLFWIFIIYFYFCLFENCMRKEFKEEEKSK